MRMTRVALVPAYEPGEIIIDLSKKLVDSGFVLVMVDDGSGPDYQELFEAVKPYGTVLSYVPNQGKGHALKLGLRYIQEHFTDAMVVTMDSDGQHLPEDALRLCEEAEQQEALVIGSRKLPSDAPARSRFGNSMTRFVYRLMTGVPVYDTQSGLRAFPQSWIPEMLSIDGERYEYEMNVLLTIAKKKMPIREIPITTIYLDKTNSVSHFDAVKDSVRIYAEIGKFAGISLVSFVIDYVGYMILLAITNHLDVANYGARAISSVVNFSLNRKVVFKSQGKLPVEAIKYFALVILIIVINTSLLKLLTGWGVNRYVAKLPVECLMFVMSYCMQHFLIFKKKG